MTTRSIAAPAGRKKQKWKRRLPFYIMALPGFAYLLMNNYIPLSGLVIPFKKLNFQLGIFESPWNGLENFRFLFATRDAFEITRNTILYNLAFMLLGTVVSIALAILINEIASRRAKQAYQTIIVLPFLVSWVIISYLAYALLAGETGLINAMFVKPFGGRPILFYQQQEYWPFILIFANLWKSAGYSMIIYLSSVVGISSDYYEAATIDGAGKWRQITRITLPMLRPTIITLFILNLGGMFRSDFGLFYQLPRNSGVLYPVTRTLDVYIYQALMKNSDYAMSSAASFYQSIVGFILIVSANAIVRKYEKNSAIF